MGSPRAVFCSIAAASTSAILAIGACTPSALPPLELHRALRRERVAVVPSAFPAIDAADLYAKSRAAGALTGAGSGIFEGLGAIGGWSCQGEICGAALLVTLAVVVVAGGTVGAIAGAARATPREESEQIEAVVGQSVHEFPAHLDLASRVVQAVHERVLGVRADLVSRSDRMDPVSDPGRLREQGFGYVLEVGVVRVEFAGGEGRDPELALEIAASARLVGADTGSSVYEREFRQAGPPRRFSDWTRGEGEQMREALSRGLDALAREIADGIFVQADLDISSGTWAFPGSRRYGSCWLTPVNPRNDYGALSRELEYTVVSSLRPSLSWDPFSIEPAPARLKSGSGGGVRDVRYDLRIWQVRAEERGSLVYERLGLPTASHRLEQPLLPQQRYFWSIRACFTIDGANPCTPWASSLVPSLGGRTCESPGIPPWNYFRFATPRQ
jgi:hypothetical protein